VSCKQHRLQLTDCFYHHLWEKQMAAERCKIKTGMGGSRNGKGRYTGTETLKKDSSKRRRQQGKAESRQS